MIEAALRSLLLALAVWAGLRIFRVRNVLAQKACWGSVLAVALAMPFLVSWSARWQIFPSSLTLVLHRPLATHLTEPAAAPEAPQSSLSFTARKTPVHGEAKARVRTRIARREKPAAAPASVIVPVKSRIPARENRETDASLSQSPLTPLPIVATGIYAAVAGLFTLRILCGLVSAMLLWLRAGKVSPALASTIGEQTAVRFSSGVSSPVTIGSAVVLPADYGDWDPAKLRIVLAHERSHVRQGDFYLQLLAAFYRAIFWPSPLGWWLKRELSDLAETISDRAGLAQASNRLSYAQILLEFAAAPRPHPIGVAMARNGSLSRRVERILNDTAFGQAFAGGRRRVLVALMLVPAALVAATCMVRVEAAQAP